MMITSYNFDTMGDVLVAILAESAANSAVEINGDVTRIFDADTNETTGYNFFGLGDKLDLRTAKGQVFLDDNQVSVLNAVLGNVGFSDVLVANPSKLVIGFVESMTPHPDSDHLNVTTTRVAADQTLQIVSGSPNMQPGIKVVVAQPGTLMPSGQQIWAGALRGVPSAGMIVSGRELKLPGAPDVPGALILPADFGEVGDAFDFAKGASLFA
jgi:tRNA-binding protein